MQYDIAPRTYSCCLHQRGHGSMTGMKPATDIETSGRLKSTPMRRLVVALLVLFVVRNVVLVVLR